ncbi:hypothetical protein [Ruficoccus sp. ZRK36]|uniref:hypothetical protein n=1 Tax=Ruficoccus sp. ZRK36 TaxID=2866311 RepID=UPI001C72E2C3|nr:hypothetical protein [Ruficoccus sp. ZRK36]QYY35415.1 hypothetical protein K0V07_14095 [Ruficoccus sp. ZRK36]
MNTPPLQEHDPSSEPEAPNPVESGTWDKLAGLWEHERLKRFRESGWYIPLLVVLGVALFAGLWGDNHDEETGFIAGQPLKSGATYYVWISEVNLFSRPGGWDLDGSAPDIAYELYTGHGNERIFKSDVRHDTLLAQWSEIGLRYSGEILGFATSGAGTVSPEEMIQAARLLATDGASLTIKVLDKDLTTDEVAGTYALALDELHTGSNAYTGQRMDGVSEVSSLSLEIVPTELLTDYLKQKYAR